MHKCKHTRHPRPRIAYRWRKPVFRFIETYSAGVSNFLKEWIEALVPITTGFDSTKLVFPTEEDVREQHAFEFCLEFAERLYRRNESKTFRRLRTARLKQKETMSRYKGARNAGLNRIGASARHRC